jgi:phospholipase C
MDYYDGNTVTALWNYAQHDAMNDNSFGTTYGPSSPGAINLISGQTHGAVGYSANVDANPTPIQGNTIAGKLANNTLYSDADPYYDNTSKNKTVALTGENVGDLLNAKNITWGWFEGGFRSATEQHTNVGGDTSTDYIPHHEPFQYYKSTANPEHLAPSSAAMIGKTDQANHQYDMTDFWTAADNNNLPAVSYVKASGYQDGHAGYSDPIDEQTFLTNTINRIESLPSWSSTAIIINYDDSDGWYDHVMPPVLNTSNDPNADALDGQGNAGTPAAGAYLDRAGYGPRIPLLIISPYAKKNYVDNTLTDQTSILRFVEDNWGLGRIGDQSMDALAGSLTNMFDFKHPTNAPMYLDPATGEVEPIEKAKNQYLAFEAKVYGDAGVSEPKH